MTTLQTAIPTPAHAIDTPEAQDVRWIAWKSKAAAADRITQGRMRIVLAVILVALACVTVAVTL